MKPEQSQADGKKETKSEHKTPNDGVENGKPPLPKSATLAEKAAILERWGLLPKRVVEQMRSSNGKEYPAEYREIISRYYEKLSEMVQETNRGK